MLIAVISDTHLPRGRRQLPEDCVERLRDADLILHAGDFISASALAEIDSIGPPLAGVHGNVDDEMVRRALPASRIVNAGDVRIAMTHDAGPAQGRLARLRGRFPEADAVVFGHSHIPLQEEAEGFQIFNPGSPTDRRRSPQHTMGLARVEGGRIEFVLVTVG